MIAGLVSIPSPREDERSRSAAVAAINIARFPAGNSAIRARARARRLFGNYRDGAARSGRFVSRRLQSPVKISLATSYIGTCRLPTENPRIREIPNSDWERRITRLKL